MPSESGSLVPWIPSCPSPPAKVVKSRCTRKPVGVGAVHGVGSGWAEEFGRVVAAERCWRVFAGHADGRLEDGKPAFEEDQQKVIEAHLDGVVVSGQANVASVDPSEAAVWSRRQQHFHAVEVPEVLDKKGERAAAGDRVRELHDGIVDGACGRNPHRRHDRFGDERQPGKVLVRDVDGKAVVGLRLIRRLALDRGDGGGGAAWSTRLERDGGVGELIEEFSFRLCAGGHPQRRCPQQKASPIHAVTLPNRKRKPGAPVMRLRG